MNQVVGGKDIIFSCKFLLLQKRGYFTNISGHMITMQVHSQFKLDWFNVSKQPNKDYWNCKPNFVLYIAASVTS